ncbi:hypothetical protein PVA34_01200 [Streptococcus pneumoniae D39]|nr:hypothetical protein [Streptococcus pneumoniae]WDT35909.1 hypothetical protein PVA34_01200 [Streptococcus pneumoniae D39]
MYKKKEEKGCHRLAQTMLEQAFTEKHYGGVLLWDSEIGNVLWL